MEKRRCELCGVVAATMYCGSDAASLCVRCDEKVHGANFLVAKHERSLLCSVCQSVTSWKASGPRLGRTVSVCDGCVCDQKKEYETVEEVVEVESRDRSGDDEEPDVSSEDEVDEEEDYEDDEEEEDEDEDAVEEEVDDENQVVPWSSGEEEVSSNSICGRELKRRRDIADLDSEVRTNQRSRSSPLFFTSNFSRSESDELSFNRRKSRTETDQAQANVIGATHQLGLSD